MSDYRDTVHCRIDPEQVWQPEGGRPVQELSVIMTDDHRSHPPRRRSPASSTGCCGGSGCRMCGERRRRCSRPPTRNAGNTPKSSRCCSPKRPPAATRRPPRCDGGPPGCRPARRSTRGNPTSQRSRNPPSRRSAHWNGSTAPRCSACAGRQGLARATSSKRSGTLRPTTARPSRGIRSRRSLPCSAATASTTASAKRSAS
jgi:hypothetical protein